MAGRTIVLGGNGTRSVTYALPAGLLQYVDAVHAHVDATGSGNTVPVLEVQNVNGVVIAAQPQDDAIPSGDTGRATWALRLAGSRRRFIHWGQNTDPTNGGLALTSVGGVFTANTGGGSYSIDTGGAAGAEGTYEVDAGDIQIRSHADHDMDLQAKGLGSVNVAVEDGDVTLSSNSGSITSGGNVVRVQTAALGFFGAAPVGQQGTPVTLGDVIALLQAYGLAA